MVAPVKDASWLEWITQLMGQPTAPDVRRQALSRSRFSCLLDEQPTHLVPERFAVTDTATPTIGAPLIVNPRCRFSRDGELHPEVARFPWLTECFALNADIVWITDPATEGVLPFWLGAEFSNLLADGQPGETAPQDLPPLARTILVNAGVLIDSDHVSRRRREWNEIVVHCRQRFQKGYVPLGGLIHPYHLAALRRYYRYLIRNGSLRLGDGQAPRRYVAHNEMVARFFHQQLTSVVTAIVGERVKPSYVYLGSYLGGEKLEKHTDREQCEFSISLCLDFSPEPAGETGWPLYLDTKAGKLTVHQAIGDGLLYRGRELAHYRDPLPQGNTSTSVFFHYVREDFSGSLD